MFFTCSTWILMLAGSVCSVHSVQSAACTKQHSFVEIVTWFHPNALIRIYMASLSPVQYRLYARHCKRKWYPYRCGWVLMIMCTMQHSLQFQHSCIAAPPNAMAWTFERLSIWYAYDCWLLDDNEKKNWCIPLDIACTLIINISFRSAIELETFPWFDL